MNFYLFCTQLYKEGFSEAGHDKGAADGVGGVLKRTADDTISRGQDLPDAATLFHALVNTGMSVKLFLVHDSDVNEFSSKMPDNLIYVPGTMAIHQLVTHEPYKIASRVVCCLCENDLRCSCYNTNRFQFPTQEHTHQSATDVVAESDTPSENLHEDQSAREVDAESNTPPENLHEDWNKLHPISGPAPGITGKWCAILYEGCIYPGIIQQSNSNQVEVQAMMKVRKTGISGQSKMMFCGMIRMKWCH